MAEGLLLMVRHHGSSAICGVLVLSTATATGTELRLGYVLARSIWGRGYGSELVAGLVAHCRRGGQIQTIVGGVEPANMGSAKVLQRNGFCLVGPGGPSEEVVFYACRIR